MNQNLPTTLSPQSFLFLAEESLCLSWAVLKRRLMFVPLPEPEPLQTNNRGPLQGDRAPDRPLLDGRTLLVQGLCLIRRSAFIASQVVELSGPIFLTFILSKYQQNIDFRCCINQNIIKHVILTIFDLKYVTSKKFFYQYKQ